MSPALFLRFYRENHEKIVDILFAGCMTATDAKNANEASFKSPEYVGEIQGKKIYHCVTWVKSGDSYTRQHIYFVGDTMTINDPMPKGKNEVSVMIDGVQYTPENSEAEIDK